VLETDAIVRGILKPFAYDSSAKIDKKETNGELKETPWCLTTCITFIFSVILLKLRKKKTSLFRLNNDKDCNAIAPLLERDITNITIACPLNFRHKVAAAFTSA